MIELSKIKPTTASTIISCLSAFFSVELMLFLLSPKLFLSLDLIRLACIGLGLTAPMILINGVIVRTSEGRSKKTKDANDREESEKFIWGIGGALTLIFVTFSTLISYSNHYSLYKTLWALFFLDLILIIIAVIIGNSKK